MTADGVTGLEWEDTPQIRRLIDVTTAALREAGYNAQPKADEPWLLRFPDWRVPACRDTWQAVRIGMRAAGFDPDVEFPGEFDDWHTRVQCTCRQRQP